MSSRILAEEPSSNSSHDLEHQETLPQKVNVTERQLEALYTLGFELYNTDNFEKAADLFRLLCIYEPQRTRNWIALGGANQNIKDYNAAIAAFLIASLQEPLSPEPRLYAAHSFIDIMNLPAALDSAQKALQLCENREDKKEVESRALSLLQALESYLSNNQVLK
ncbi:MAG: tetratricopeptide repeat protein [Chthoniobacterales bacterium]